MHLLVNFKTVAGVPKAKREENPTDVERGGVVPIVAHDECTCVSCRWADARGKGGVIPYKTRVPGCCSRRQASGPFGGLCLGVGCVQVLAGDIFMGVRDGGF